MSQEEIDRAYQFFENLKSKKAKKNRRTKRKTKSKESFRVCPSCKTNPPVVFRILCGKCTMDLNLAFIEATTRVL